MKPIVIVGSGLAGYTLARELRKIDRDVPLVVVTRDAGGFYSKPMLSNALALRKQASDLASAGAESMAAQLDARVEANARVIGLDVAARALQVEGRRVEYSQLVLAVGADPIAVPLSGNAASGVLRVNDLADYARFRAALEGKRRVAILGAGLIGCEFANDLAGAGYAVDVIDPAPHPLGRLLPAAAASRLEERLAAAGVRWHLGTTAASVDALDGGLSVELANGERLETELVLSAIGLSPRIALAREAGLLTRRGIVVDRFLRTSADDVYAVGDCAEVEGLVLPYVMPLMHGARALAKTLAGTPTPVSYPAMPVVVKTPALPVVVAPPAAGASGQWVVTADEAGVEARFEDGEGRLLGFALLGGATERKGTLTRLLPPVLA